MFKFKYQLKDELTSELITKSCIASMMSGIRAKQIRRCSTGFIAACVRDLQCNLHENLDCEISLLCCGVTRLKNP